MKLFSAISEWLKRKREQSQEAQQQKRNRSLAKTSWEKINVIEFEGRIYIAYNDIPIVRVDDLKVKVPELIAQAREDYLLWKEKFEE